MGELSAFVSLCADLVAAVDLVPIPCPTVLPGERYVLDEILSIGPRSWVYRGRDLSFRREGLDDPAVVVKVFRRADSEEHESILGRRGEHPHIVKVLDRGRTREGYPYLVEEFVRGGDLSGVERPMALTRALVLVRQVSEAAHRLHTQAIVHCDIKPANVLLEGAMHAKLADFELAASPVSDAASFRGTRAFMSPEQLANEPGCHRPATDIYALGKLLAWLVESPEGGRGQRRTPRRLARVIERATAVDPSRRHASAAELADDLLALLEHRPIAWQRESASASVGLWCRRRPATAVGLIAAGVLALGAGAGWYRSRLNEAERALDAQREALRLAEVEIAKLRSAGRSEIRDSIRRLMAMRGKGEVELRASQVLAVDPFLAAEDPLLRDAGSLTGDVRIRIVKEELERRASAGDGVDVIGLRLLLAGLYVDGGKPAEARPLLAAVRARWAERLASDDPLWDRVRAIELCMEVPTDEPGRTAWLDEARAVLNTGARVPERDLQRLRALVEGSSVGDGTPGGGKPSR